MERTFKNKKLVIDLLETAQADLKAAMLLHRKKYYPQCIFLFSQSVEKSNKAYGLLTNAIEEKDLTSKIRHQPIKIHEKILKNHQKNLLSLRFGAQIYPSLKSFTGMSEKEVEESLKGVQDFLKNLDELKKEQDTVLNISEEEIQNYLYEMKTAYGEARKQHKEMSKIKVKQKDVDGSMDDLVKAFKDVPTESNFEEDVLKMKGVGTEVFSFMIKYFSRLMIDIYPAYIVCISLSVLTIPHSIKSRYPGKFSPSQIYTKDLPLVRKLRKLSKYQKKAIKDLNNFVKLYDKMEVEIKELADKRDIQKKK